MPSRLSLLPVMARSWVPSLKGWRIRAGDRTGHWSTVGWSFFRDAVERLLSPGHRSEFDSISPTQAAQYKFEVEAKLRKHYLRAARAPRLVFSLIHQRDLSVSALEEQELYPRLAGYCVLVRDHMREAVNGTGEPGLSR